MNTKFFYFLLFCVLLSQGVKSQVVVGIDASQEPQKISKYIYGKNNSLSDNASSPLSAADWTRIKDAGVVFLRESGGNNSTKYNWKYKLSSHPDWYNNVYAHDWDFAVQSLQNEIPDAQGMWSFQLLGKAAKTTDQNFGDYAYNNSQWWSGVNQNLAGGGTVNDAGGSQALVDGNPDLYLMDWPADSTVEILNHWFGAGGLGLDQSQLLYWSMDNEVEIWSGTHDDVMKTQISAEEFMQLYFKVAKKARAIFPEIKLCGPVPANEWQWYNWDNSSISYNGKEYCWLEYFILRVAEEQKASGIKLLDVLDIHFYPGTTNSDEILQLHRVYFDRSYVFPEANGVKRVNGGWDNNQDKEYIFGRCNDWLTEYIGVDHGVTFGVSETSINASDPNIFAVWYASTLGEFMKEGVEFFSPWDWDIGMWEVLHLFSNFNFNNYLSSSSNQEELVSGYATINDARDSLSVVLVNRSTSGSKEVTVNLNGFYPVQETSKAYRLSNLPGTETFVSHSNNALEEVNIVPSGNSVALTLPQLSVTTLILSGGVVGISETVKTQKPVIVPNPVHTLSDFQLNIDDIQSVLTIEVFDTKGTKVAEYEKPDQTGQINLSGSSFMPGEYIIYIRKKDSYYTEKLIVVD